MGFFKIDYEQIGVSRQGWIYLAFTLPLTFLVLGMSFAWILWTGTKLEKPTDDSGRALVQAAEELRLRASPENEGV